ncbi:MAG: division/cell wall cluster transcriptional repressor MraZ [Thiobacillaceae bacterium]|nr:division/cell wall cluster transcriptional repressor MraZ [Thiobacillaceae bacterium]
MFRGFVPLSLDGKGRLAIPSKYRDALHERCGGRLVLTLDPGRCMLLYPYPDWEPIERRIMELSSFHPLSRQLKLILVGSATDVEMDASGRILVPAPLREQARLDKDVVLVGQGAKFELWNAAQWQAEYDAAVNFTAALEEARNKGTLPDELRDFAL